MFIKSYLGTAKEILEKYKGQEPLNTFLKKYFDPYKKFGSRDRKYITDLCYCFFRLGRSLLPYSFDEKFSIALFLCNNSYNALLERLNKEWNDNIGLNIDDKLTLVSAAYDFKLEDVFPLQQHLSESIGFKSFVKSFFNQPDTFLRTRPRKQDIVKQKLSKAGISFKIIGDRCVAVSPSTKLDKIIDVNREAVIQDLNSQQTLDLFCELAYSQEKIRSAWDCCAASGGKSILLKDHLPDIDLTVSDVRESILINLKKRFQQAGINKYKWLVADLSLENFINKEKYDLVICDAPCSGSGTWSRTPEQLYFFNESKIDDYASLQKKIVTNAIKSLKPGGFFIYITCSVFKKENEEIVHFIKNGLSLHLMQSEYLKGYQRKADTLFTALFRL